MTIDKGRIIFIDPDPDTRAVFGERLRAQGFVVDEASDAARGAEIALGNPPRAVVSDLWMPGVSGVQLCRLLRSEPATAHVPIVLRAAKDEPSSRFWARQAGAAALVSKGRMGDLMRALVDVVSRPEPEVEFFFHMSGGAQDVRDRIAAQLDRALFDSVVAAEVRALASASTFARLFDSLSQLVAQLVNYRWLSVATISPPMFAVHASDRTAAAAVDEARAALGIAAEVPVISVLDADASDAPAGRTVTLDIGLGSDTIGRLSISVTADDEEVDRIAPLVASELGGPIRLVMLAEESLRLATTDGLSGLYNRRAFGELVARELDRSDRYGTPLSMLLIDLDHFKSINDTRGHAAGDAVIEAVGGLLKKQARGYDIVARWGGEEFVVALPGVDQAAMRVIAERIRGAIELLAVKDPRGEPIALTASIGGAVRTVGESTHALVDRADHAMYRAKVGGRNRVAMEEPAAATEAPALAEAS